MKKKLSILISSCGRRVQMIDAFRKEGHALGVDLVMAGCDVEPEYSPATEFLDSCFRVPRCDSEEFIPALLQIASTHKIGLIIPTIDPEIPILAAHRDQFLALGTDIAVSGVEVAKISCDKLATNDWAKTAGISTPATYSIAEARLKASQLSYPLIAKPVAGSGSFGIRKIETASELYSSNLDVDFLVQKFVSGIEFTVNMYFDLREGRLHCVIPHRRLEVRTGEVSKGVTVRSEAVEKMALAVAQNLVGARGCICFQAIQDESGKLHLIEINARFGGGFPLAYMAGAAFSRWMIEDVLKMPSSAHNNWEDGVFMLRYDSAVFLK